MNPRPKLPTLLALLFTLVSIVNANDWPEPTATHKPWTRWWWHGSAVEKAELTRELESFAAAGFGGVEITPIYGVQGNQHLEKDFLSEEWFAAVEHACLEAQRLGLQVDIVPGTGWRLGREDIPESERALEIQIRWDGSSGDVQNPHPTLQPHLSGERVKRPAPGGSGYTIDMLDRDTVSNYFDHFNQAFFNRIDPSLVRAVFHDSWEYETDWSRKLAEETLEGQTIPWDQRASLFAPDTSSLPASTLERWRYDYRRVIEQMLLQNFSDTWNEKTHELGLLTRNQAHGSIASLLDVYAKTDIPETEIFGDSEPFLLHKFASSAAHVTGKPLVSAESYTWLGEHWTVDLAKLKRATDYLFLCGVNHAFFHGTAYSPPDAAWPGWVFYASTQLHDRNPLWHHLPALNQYITRCQSLLQSGKPYADLYLYAPLADPYSEVGGTKLRQNIDGKRWFNGTDLEKNAQALWDAGIHFDYISDRQLQELATQNAPTPTILIPKQKRIPLATAQALDTLARQGNQVVTLQDPTTWQIPGTINAKHDQAQLDTLTQSVPFTKRPLEELTRSAPDSWQATLPLRCIRRVNENGSHLYFVVNRSETTQTVSLPIESERPSIQRLDPWTGKTGALPIDKNKQLTLTLAPFESTFIRSESSGRPYEPIGQPSKQIELNSPWTLRFLSGGPTLPAPIQLETLTPINFLEAQQLDAFAGLLSYETDFELSATEAKQSLQLDLGALSSSAQVYVNDQLAGTLIRSPFQISIPAELIHEGSNQLRIEVATLADNRIRHMDRTGQKWRIFNDINFVNIDYKAFDASDWQITDYGLFGPVTLATSQL